MTKKRLKEIRACAEAASCLKDYYFGDGAELYDHDDNVIARVAYLRRGRGPYGIDADAAFFLRARGFVLELLDAIEANKEQRA